MAQAENGNTVLVHYTGKLDDGTVFDSSRERDPFEVTLGKSEVIPGFEQAFLLDMPEIGVRETRHIQGEYRLTIEDILQRKEFEDSIGRGAHPIDIGRLPEELREAGAVDDWYFTIPYRSLVAREVDNLLLAGRCISASHEASGCTRPTVQCMITGQAAGFLIISLNE